MIDFGCYRTNSHFGFRIPTKLWQPKHFHLPNMMPLPMYGIPFIVKWADCWMNLKSNQKSIRSDQGHDDSDHENQLPPIKCSLCSTPRKNNNNNHSKNEDRCYDDTICINQSDVSIISTISNSSCQSNIQPHAEHCSNRLIVRIIARSK